MKKRLILLTLSLLAAFLLAGCGGAEPAEEPQTEAETAEAVQETEAEEPAEESEPAEEAEPEAEPEPEPAEEAVPQEPIVLTGSGDNVLTLDPIPFQYYLHVTGNAEGKHFAVKGYDADNQGTELFVNTTKPYEGQTYDKKQATVLLEVKATGDWTIELVPVSTLNTVQAGETVTGAGDTMFRLEGSPATAAVEGNADGKHFAVKGYIGDRSDLMVNTTDPYSGTVMVKPDTELISVDAEGDWSIQFSE